jgi:DNA repair exonuclease SbcCD nuclease subunit
MRLIHSADWQLGARFAQFKGMAQRLRQARLETLHRTIERAAQLHVDALLIAGDLFADSQVEDTVIQTALDMIAGAPDLPVFILPGNHDPYTGPGCIWERKPFQKKPANVAVFNEPTVCEVAGAFLIARPLLQKVSTIDPSIKFVELVRDLPTDRIRVGITHGAPAIPGKHQPNDFPIALNAATRSGLDYLALGHWHNSQVYNGGRMAMSGTPEPDQFGQTSSGNVMLVEISQRGEAPKLTTVPVFSLRWQELEFDILDFEATRQSLIASVGAT